MPSRSPISGILLASRAMWTRGLILIALLAALPAAGQQGTPLIEWLLRLQTLRAELASVKPADQAALDRVRRQTAALRSSVSRWLVAHPQPSISQVPPAAELADPPGLEAEIEALTNLVEQLMRLKPTGPFQLGRVEVTVTAEAPQALGASVLDSTDIERHARAAVTDVLAMAPAVAAYRVGSRSEGVVYIRGFEMRQIPVYLDGIPIYAPYEGYADLDRLAAHEIAEVQIAKGFSSPLYGPNALGGAVNLISRKPAAPHYGEFGAGWASGRTISGFASLGARLRTWYVQAGGAGLGRDHFPLSSGFTVNALQPTLERLNSDRRDGQGHFKIGFTPREDQEYVLGYLRQSTRKGQPPYAGDDAAVRVRYWRWPALGKDTLYQIARRRLAGQGHFRLRAYYDRSTSRLNSYDDAAYSTMNKPGSFISLTSDSARGATVELGTGARGGNSFTGAFFFKDDVHQEHNLGEPARKFHSQTLSLGLEDEISLTPSLRVAVGLGVDRLGVLRADDFRSGLVVPFPTGSLWAFGPQVGITWAVSEIAQLRLNFARKTRLPTMKDRYSYRMGRSIPNPSLAEERASSFEAALSRPLGRRTLVEVAAFDSEVSGLMQSYALAPGLYQIRNLGRSRHLGGEFSIKSTPARPLWARASYAFLNRQNLSDPAVALIQSPRHAFFGSVGARLPADIMFTGEASVSASRWDLSEGGRYVRLKGFALLGWNAAIPLGRAVELRAGMRNVGDRNYFLDEGFPEEGRSCFLSLRYRFSGERR